MQKYPSGFYAALRNSNIQNARQSQNNDSLFLVGVMVFAVDLYRE